MATIPLSEARAKLPELLDRLAPGEELVITRDDRTVTVVSGGAGSVRGVTWIAQRHWDAVPACYFGGGLAGMGFYTLGWSPLAGFAVGFVAVAAVVAVAYAALTPGPADAR